MPRWAAQLAGCAAAAVTVVAAGPRWMSPAAAVRIVDGDDSTDDIAAGADSTVTIDPGQSWGVWQGWGTSLAWWANCYGQRDDLADVFFTLDDVPYAPNGEDNDGDGNDDDHAREQQHAAATTIPGLGLTIARYNVGGSSNASAHGANMVQSPNMPWWKAIQGFWDTWDSADPASSSWTWAGRDTNQIAMLKKAQVRGADTFQLFSNSPMWWMCTNHNPSGNDVGADDNLQTWNHEQHAQYLAVVVEHFRDYLNVSFDSVEPFNEPNSDWWKASGTQEGCHFSPQTQASVLAALRAELTNRSLPTAIAASDENSYTLALSTWQYFSDTTKGLVDQVDVHGYEQARGPRAELYKASKGKVLWNSEYGEGDASGESLITNLNMDIALLHPTAWVYWQVVDGSSWGMVEASDEGQGKTGVVQTKFYVAAHYTRHVRPGFEFVAATDSEGGYGTVAAWHSASRTVVVVSGNVGDSDVTRTFDVSKFAGRARGPAATVNISNWRTQMQGGGDRYAKQEDIVLPAGATSFSAKLGAHSIRTFEFVLGA